MLKAILKRSRITLIFVLLFVIIGIFTFFQLPQREIPETEVNIGTVSTVYPGATVETVERTVTNQIEDSLQSIDGVSELNSSSAAGFSTIIVEVEDGADKKEVFSNVRQAVSDAAAGFPDEVFEPEVNESIVKLPIVSYQLTAETRESLEALRGELDRWTDEVTELAGVEGVAVKGLSDEEILIKLQPDALKEAGLNVGSVMSAINAEFYPTPLGKQEIDNEVVQLSVENYSSIEEMNEVFIGKNPQGESVLLGDVADVEVTPKEVKDLITFEGKPAISFTAFVQAGEDIPTVDERVSEKVGELAEGLPEGIELVPYYSQASQVTDIFDGLFTSLAISVVAVVIATSLGLTGSGAFVVALAVPISVLMGLIPLPYAEVDLNQISVVGAIIALGILVDDSIVVNDNIQRRYKLGDGALAGAITGVKEIWVSIVTSSFAIVFTFLPLVFLSGGNGAFIRALPTVLITTIVASTLVALIFVPVMRYLLYSKTRKKISDSPGFLGKPLDKLADFYADTILKKFSKRPFITSLIGLVFTTAIFGLVVLTPFEFFPTADREEVTIDVTLPLGTTLEETAGTLAEMEEVLKTDEGVYETSVFAGTGVPNLFTGSMSNTGSNTGQIVVRVDRENQTAKGLIDDWTEKLRDEFPDAVLFMETIQQGPPVGAPVTVTVSGPELEQLLQLRDTIIEDINKLETNLVVDNVGEFAPTIEYIPNRELMEENGITVNQISEQIRLATEGIPLKSFDNGIKKRDMTIVLQGDEGELDLSALEVPAASPNLAGPPALISLDDLVTIEKKEEIQQIPHKDGERAITIRAFPLDEEGYKENVQNIVADIKNNLNKNYSVTIGGENEAQEDFFSEIIILFTIVIFLVYLLIALQFNSLSLPFLVLVAVYLAIAGAILGLFVTQTPISFLGVMGMVSLTGIVVRNSIVLIEFIEQRKEDMDVKEAVVEAGRTRLRPILLTALTSIVALLPVAVSGDALFTPLAVTIISGILFSAILTLLIVPMLYLVFDRFRRNKKEKAVS
ncbi:efflux RND transporter permease subunit [Bacillus sp. SG-1]|uniref:efflux RND transporter permease subunit n=1 Tax=Bacillus sp. SG-1 TaxID=161544 RepID=UPI000154323F|nr:efflux RND transporter permease subunit [Bacillus sp. SG-1]EDL66663.1 Cation/multidrug efflux pump [Bacillus sp. SG-1]